MIFFIISGVLKWSRGERKGGEPFLKIAIISSSIITIIIAIMWGAPRCHNSSVEIRRLLQELFLSFLCGILGSNSGHQAFVASHRPRRTILDITQLTLLAQNLFLGDDLAVEPQWRRGGLCSLEKEGQSEVFYTDCLLPCLGWHTSFFFMTVYPSNLWVWIQSKDGVVWEFLVLRENSKKETRVLWPQFFQNAEVFLECVFVLLPDVRRGVS